LSLLTKGTFGRDSKPLLEVKREKTNEDFVVVEKRKSRIGNNNQRS